MLQVFEKLHLVIKWLEDKKKRIFYKKQRVYLGILAAFLFGFIFIGSSSIWLNSGRKYVSIPLNKPQAFGGQANIEVVDRQYNKDKNLYIETLFVSHPEEQVEATNAELSVESVTKKRPSKKLHTEIRNINNQLYVLIVHDLKPNFDTLRHSIQNKTNPGQLNEYVNESQIPINNHLVVKSKKFYELASVQYEIRITRRTIQNLKNKIKKLHQENKQLDKKISTTKKEMNFQTKEEQDKSILAIKRYENRQKENDKKVLDLKAEIQTHNEKIQLLMEKIKVIQENQKVQEKDINETEVSQSTVESTQESTENTTSTTSDTKTVESQSQTEPSTSEIVEEETTTSSSLDDFRKMFITGDDNQSVNQTTETQENN